MQIRLVDIGPEGLELEQKVERTWLVDVLSGDYPTQFTPSGEAGLSAKLIRAGLDVIVQADCSLSLSTDCASCLTRFELEVPVSFNLTLKPKPKPKHQKDVPTDLEIGQEELNEFYFQGDTLDLAELLREQIILALPMFPRCSEQCLGLCPRCGANRNQSTCDCERTEIDPRWAALKSFKTQ